MPRERLREVLDGFSAARDDLLVSLYLGGEPLLHPTFPDLVQTARNLGYWNLRIHTNGTVTRPGIWEELIHAGLRDIIFSVDGEDAADYERIRGWSFAVVRRSIEECLEALRHRPADRTRAGVFCLVGPGKPLEVNRDLRDLLPELAPGLVTVQRPHGWLRGGEIPESTPCAEPPQTPCFFLRHYMAVNVRGEYLPCCLFLNSEVTLGTVDTLDGASAWGGPVEKLRQSQKRGDSLPLCSQCERHDNGKESLKA